MTEDFERRMPRPQEPLATPPFHAWQSPDGCVWLAFHRTDTGIILRFPDLADFEVTPDGQWIACSPAPDSSADTITHLFLNQVLPLAMSARGFLSFHASAVTLGECAVAFPGRTGQGKSTLAASFSRNGSAFLTDDGLVLTETGGDYLVQPSHPSLRLWPDSEDALLNRKPPAILPAAYTPKTRFAVEGDLRHCAVPRPLRALFFLGPGETAEPEIRPIPPSEAMVGLLSNAFQLDVEDKAALRRQFGSTARLCDRVPGFRLDYPRRYEVLPAVREAVATVVERLKTQTP